MNTVHWPGFGLFPLQICRVKSILPEEGGRCVCVYVCLCKSRRTKWFKVKSHFSEHLNEDFQQRKKQASEQPRSRKEQGKTPKLILFWRLLPLQAVPAVDGNTMQWLRESLAFCSPHLVMILKEHAYGTGEKGR